MQYKKSYAHLNGTVHICKLKMMLFDATNSSFAEAIEVIIVWDFS